MQVRTMQVRKDWEANHSKILARSCVSIRIGLYRLPVVGGIFLERYV